jgi:hypothetical protein
MRRLPTRRRPRIRRCLPRGSEHDDYGGMLALRIQGQRRFFSDFLNAESARGDLSRANLEVRSSCNFGRPPHMRTAAMRSGLARTDQWIHFSLASNVHRGPVRVHHWINNASTLELNVHHNQKKATEDRTEVSRYFVELLLFQFRRSSGFIAPSVDRPRQAEMR